MVRPGVSLEILTTKGINGVGKWPFYWIVI